MWFCGNFPIICKSQEALVAWSTVVHCRVCQFIDKNNVFEVSDGNLFKNTGTAVSKLNPFFWLNKI